MKNQNARNYAVVAVAAMLLATFAASMATPENAYAYKKNQATSQANACGNGELPLNIGCQNTGSQIQGDENSVALAAQQTFPAAEVVPPVDGDGDACRDCLELLSTAQLQGVAQQLGLTQTDRNAIIDEICRLLELGPSNGGISVGRVNGAMASSGLIDVPLRQEVRDCLRAVF
jgi:hypothetical protein